ncbi:MAG: hypothetical protein JKP90_00390 [Desulfofustis sp. PB-SRB1]|nr:hypothetical protein [Desulfofustis sp. PB-SRB1]
MARAGRGYPFVVTEPAQAPGRRPGSKSIFRRRCSPISRSAHQVSNSYDVEPAAIADLFCGPTHSGLWQVAWGDQRRQP